MIIVISFIHEQEVNFKMDVVGFTLRLLQEFYNFMKSYYCFNMATYLLNNESGKLPVGRLRVN